MVWYSRMSTEVHPRPPESLPDQTQGNPMQQLNQKKLDSVFVPASCPTFADLLARLAEDGDLSPTRRRDLSSGLRRVANALSRSPEDVFCDARWLQPRLSKVQPAALGLTTKSWQNAVSDARAAMAHFGTIKLKTNRIEDLSATWKPLWSAVAETRDQSILSALRRFVYFLDRLGVDPLEVTDEHALAYKQCVAEQEISRSPEVAYRAAVNGWNLARARVGAWPDIQLNLPDRRKVIQLPVGVLPEAFYEDLETYLTKLTAADPFADDGPARAHRPATILQYRRLLLRFAARMVESGTAPDDINGLLALTEPDRVKKALRVMLEYNAQKTSESISATARLLRNVARSLNAPDSWQQQLENMARKVAIPHQVSMTQKNRARLRALQNEQNLVKLLTLPDALVARKRGGNAPRHDAIAREDAVAIAILTYCPIRIKNLSQINLEQNLHRLGDGSAYLVFEDDETKNRRPIEYELPREVVALIDEHLKTRVPHLCPAGTAWLFPKRKGHAAIGPSELGARIFKRILKETGLEVNAHLFRHLSVMIYLEAHPGAYEGAGRLIGHSNTSRTIRLYSGMETRSATQEYSNLVTSKKARG